MNKRSIAALVAVAAASLYAPQRAHEMKTAPAIGEATLPAAPETTVATPAPAPVAVAAVKTAAAHEIFPRPPVATALIAFPSVSSMITDSLFTRTNVNVGYDNNAFMANFDGTGFRKHVDSPSQDDGFSYAGGTRAPRAFTPEDVMTCADTLEMAAILEGYDALLLYRGQSGDTICHYEMALDDQYQPSTSFNVFSSREGSGAILSLQHDQDGIGLSMRGYEGNGYRLVSADNGLSRFSRVDSSGEVVRSLDLEGGFGETLVALRDYMDPGLVDAMMYGAQAGNNLVIGDLRAAQDLSEEMRTNPDTGVSVPALPRPQIF